MSINWREEFKDLGRMVRTRRARKNLRGTTVRGLTLSLTYRCNARCEMCFIWKKDTSEEKKKELKPEHIDRLAASPYFSQLVSLGLTGGETLLYERLPEVIETFHKYHPPRYVSLATNGFLPERTERVARQILDRFPTELWLNVSFDGMDETHNKIRGVPNVLEKTKATLERLAAMRREYSHLGVGILFTLQPHNYEQMIPVFRYARRNKVQFRFNPINYGEEYYERDPHIVMKEYSEVLPEIEEQFKILDREEPEDLFGRKFRSLFRPYVESDNKPVIPCFAAVANAFINPHGDVFPCVPARKDFLLGNIKEQSFDEIWESDKAKQTRKRIQDGVCKCLITCETSNAIRYSTPYQVQRIGRAAGRMLRGKSPSAGSGRSEDGKTRNEASS